MPDPSALIETPGKIITFYSYKGGTGRSMALANVAWLLTANGHRVLAIDWDLEAPGLHRYLLPFLRDPELTETRGVIDLLWDYANLALTPQSAWPSSIQLPTDLADVRPYLAPLENPFAKAGGCFHFLSAGQQVPAYASRFRDFDWRALYERQGGGAFFDKLAERLRTQYEFILIDSRTGVADTSGICTVQLPDEVVLCFTYNRQSVKGVAAVAQSIIAQRSKPPTILPVPMRVEKGIEGLNEAQDFAREELDRFLPHNWSNDERASYWENCEVSYYPDYAFGETLAVFRDRKRSRNSLIADMRWLASRFLASENEPKFPSLDDDKRDAILRRYRLRDPRRAELADLLAQPESSSATGRLIGLAREAIQISEPDKEYNSELGRALTTAAKALALSRPEAALSLAQVTTEFYRWRAHEEPIEFLPALASSLSDLGTVLATLGRSEDSLAALREALEIRRGLSTKRPHAFDPDLGLSLNNLGNALLTVGERESGTERLEEAVTTFRAALLETTRERAPLDWAMTQNNLGLTLFRLGERESGTARLEEAAAAFRAALEERTREGVPLQWANTQTNLGNTLAMLGEREAARTRLEEAVAAYRASLQEMTRERVPLQWAITQTNLGTALAMLGELDEALRIRTEDQLPVYQRLGDVRAVARTQGQIADILQARGRMDEALRIRREEQLPVYQRLGDVRAVAGTQGQIADILQARGQLDEALRIRREEQLSVYQRLGDVGAVAHTQGKIADIKQARGETDEALALHEECLATYRRLGDIDGIRVSLCSIAQIEIEGKQFEKAFSRLAEAWPLIVKRGRPDSIGEVGEVFGQLLAATGSLEEARNVLGQAAAANRKLGRAGQAARIEAMITDISKRQS